MLSVFLSCLTGVLQGIEIGCLFHVKHFDRGTKREIVEVITFRLSFGNNCFTFGIMNYSPGIFSCGCGFVAESDCTD